MRNYDAIRDRCTRALELSGELRTLGAEARALLERGSLVVLAATRLAQLDRRRRAARCFEVGAPVALALLVASSAPRLGAALRSPSPVALTTGLVAVCLVVFALGHRESRRTARRRLVYEHIEREADPTAPC